MRLRLSSLIVLSALTLDVRAQSGAETYGRDVYWNATPNDVNSLLKSLKELADINYNMDVRSLAQVSPG